MNKEEKKFELFFKDVTGIVDINDVDFSPNFDNALSKDMDIRKAIGNINLIQGNIRSKSESEKIVNNFLSVEIP
ncbi:MAG: hypothetical protein PF487_05655 [Bacteroidales bacterium]|jgi:hypothetical protein|nr:hypothetical protein [Bacteroidales bacterium]